MVYLDNASTTFVRPTVYNALNSLRHTAGNPSSYHKIGRDMRYEILKCKDRMIKCLTSKSADDYDVCFTSGGTESNNIAIVSAVTTFPGKKKIISSSIEHSSVYNTLKCLESIGYEVVFLKPDKNGMISTKEIEDNIDSNTALVSIMHVNNEVGTIQDVNTIGDICSSNNVLFHCDCVQSAGHIKIDLSEMKADMISISFHKFGGIKGSGALIHKRNVKLFPIMYGGSQNNGIRPGTENFEGIISGAIALEESCIDMERNFEIVKSFNDIIKSGLSEEKIDFKITCDSSNASPYIMNIGFAGIDKDFLLTYLDGHEIYVSATSACESNKSMSRVLEEISLADLENSEYYNNAIRVSFSEVNNLKECIQFVESVTNYIRLKELENERDFNCSEVIKK